MNGVLVELQEEQVTGMDFFRPRKRAGFDRWDAVVFVVYASVLAFAIHHYLPFADEAQAWLIARDCSLHEMLFRRLHYEGAPALWPLILWVATRLHMPYAAINWMAGAFALPGIYLLLRYSPFPRIFRWLMPFTYFFQYQYAVIARPYVLVPALLFTMCILFTQARPRPVLFALAAGLLANISLHAAIVAGIFCLLYLYELRRLRRQSAGAVSGRAVAAGAGVFLMLALLSVAAAFPAPDAAIASEQGQTALEPSPLLRRLIQEERLPRSSPPLDPFFVPERPNPQAEAEAATYPKIVRLAVTGMILSASAACYPIASSNFLAVIFLGAIWFWLWARGCPRLLCPFAASVLLSVHVFVLAHHTGIFLLSLVAAAWIALRMPEGDDLARRRLPWIQPAFAAVALVVIVLQIGWSWHCIYSEVYTASDPGRETEQFLTQDLAGKRIAGFGFESVSAQPYASNSLFFNQPHTYWLWSVNVLTDRRRTETLQKHPDAVVVGDIVFGKEYVFNQWGAFIPAGMHPFAQMLSYWQEHGYRETHRFCGYRYSRMGVENSFCEVIMQPEPNAGGLGVR